MDRVKRVDAPVIENHWSPIPSGGDAWKTTPGELYDVRGKKDVA